MFKDKECNIEHADRLDDGSSYVKEFVYFSNCVILFYFVNKVLSRTEYEATEVECLG